MNQANLFKYNLITPKADEIANIGRTIIDNGIKRLPVRLRNNVPLFKYLLKEKYQQLFLIGFENDVYSQIDIDDIIPFIVETGNIFSALPAYQKNPLFWDKLLESYDFAVFNLNPLYNHDYDTYKQIDKKIIANALSDMYSYDDFRFMRNDSELLKTVIDNGYTVDLDAFNPELLSEISDDKLIDYYAKNHIISNISKRILENRELLTRLCDQLSKSDVYALSFNDELPLENRLDLVIKYDLYVDDNITDLLADYIIANNITSLSVNMVTKVANQLIKKKTPLILDLLNNPFVQIELYIDSKTLNDLIELYYNIDYQKPLNNNLRSLIFGSEEANKHIQKVGDYIIRNGYTLSEYWPISNNIELFNYLMEKHYKNIFMCGLNNEIFETISEETLADCIIQNELTFVPDTKNAYLALSILINRQYKPLFDIYLYQTANFVDEIEFKNDVQLDDETKKNLCKLFFDADYDGFLSTDMLDIILNNKESLKYIDKLGDYIIKNQISELHSTWACHDSVELFNYLLEKDYDKVLSLNFDISVFESIPSEKLKDFLTRHPNQPVSGLSNKLRLLFKDINFDHIDYNVIKNIILYESRLNANRQMTDYNALSRNVGTLLQRMPYFRVYERYQDKFDELCLMMEMSHEELLTLLSNCQNEPGLYETELIELMRRFISKKKENTALDIFERRIDAIKERVTYSDKKEIARSMLLFKQKETYLTYLKTILGDNYQGADREELIKLVEKLNLSQISENHYTLAYDILMGNQVINEPNSYVIYKKLQILDGRLNKNYLKSLVAILDMNAIIKDDIIGYLNGNYSFKDLRRLLDRLLDTGALKTLQEIRNLCVEADAKFDQNMMSFVSPYSITDEDRKLNREYDQKLIAINTLRKYLNSDMRKRYPNGDVTLTDEDIEKYSMVSLSSKRYLDPNKMDSVDDIIKVFEYRKRYTNPTCIRVFDKLFIESGIVYGLPFLDKDFRFKLINLASKMDYLIQIMPEEDINFNNLTTIIKQSEVFAYTTPYRHAILGDDIIREIAYQESYVFDHGEEARDKRVESATKYLALASRNVKSTMPYSRVETEHLVAERLMVTILKYYLQELERMLVLGLMVSTMIFYFIRCSIKMVSL